MSIRLLALLVVTALAGCGSDGTRYDRTGPHPVGHMRVALNHVARSRMLVIRVWYPAAESERAEAEAGAAIEDTLGPEGAVLKGLLAAAPDPGTRRRTRSKLDALVASQPAGFPTVLFSHCHNCAGFSSFTIAERLASHGFLVIAPDHQGNTLFDAQAGAGLPLDESTLTLRAGDISATLDAFIAGTVPEVLRGRVDAARVGIFGHSFGGATTGRVLQDDPRFVAGAVMAAPIATPFFPSVSLARVTEPVLFVRLQEDNSIGRIGNDFILDNFDSATQPVWLAELADAGHWSVSDLCGVTSEFNPGCVSPATRQTNGATFSYGDITLARDTAATYVTAFFALHLLGDAGARGTLETARGPATVEQRN